MGNCCGCCVPESEPYALVAPVHADELKGNVHTAVVNSYLITVPHAICLPAPHPELHPCDTAAPGAAQALAAAMPDSVLYKYPPYSRQKPVSNGKGMDMNRFISDATDWSTQLRALGRSGNYTGLIDVHSFPGNAAGDDYYFIAQAPFTEFALFVANDLYGRAKSFKTSMSTPHTGGENAILLHAQEWARNCIVVEVSEWLTDERIWELMKLLAESIRRATLRG